MIEVHCSWIRCDAQWDGTTYKSMRIEKSKSQTDEHLISDKVLNVVYY